MKVRAILKTDGIIKSTSDELLSTILAQLSSSHDAAFIFDNDKFLGVINPYYNVIKTSFPSRTKVSSCLVHPPKVSIDDNIKEASRLMIESKIHYLPVFENEKFVGIISARRILKAIVSDELFKISIAQLLTNKQSLVLIKDGKLLSDALDIFKRKRVSKLVVTGSDNKLVGVLSFYDLIDYLSQPRERVSTHSRMGERNSRDKKNIKMFYKTLVLTISQDKSVSEAIQMILDNGIGSVVIIDRIKKPLGIITTKDILNLFISNLIKRKISFIGKIDDEQGNKLIREFIQIIEKKINKKSKEIHAVIEIQHIKSKTKYYMSIKLYNNKGLIMKIEKYKRDLSALISEMKNTIDSYLSKKTSV